MLNFDLLGSLMRDLHHEFVRLYYLMLPVFFALAVALTWFRSPQGSPEFLDVVKRAIVSTILLVAFPDISRAIIFITEGIAERIDHMSSLDVIIKMAQNKAQSYSFSTRSILLQFNDLILATLSFLSYLILYVARYLTIAMYHFFWLFFMVSAPLLILFNMFGGTSHITANLFKGMIEVASWKIVWAILGAMLSALSFGNAYQTEGNYLTLIVMNFVISIAMLMTPMVVKSIVSGGMQSMSTAIGTTTIAAMAAAPAKVITTATATREVFNSGKSYVNNSIESFRSKPN